MDPKHKGSRSELIATAWLLGEGYEVFRNASQHGEVDLMVEKDGIILLFDVKTIPPARSARELTLTPEQIARGVNLLAVSGHQCEIIEAPNVRRVPQKK